MKSEHTITDLNQDGFILIVVLFILMIISLLVNSLLFAMPLQHRFLVSSLYEMQQFEATESGLRHGENLLINQLLQKKAPHITSVEYFGYNVHIDIIQLPQAFCILPDKRIGHYYQLSASTQSKFAIAHGVRLCLQSTVAIPDGPICTEALPKRPMGRSAWSQIH